VLFALLRMEPNRSAWRFLKKEKVMVTIKVKDGTPESRGTLCTTCRSARVVKGYRAGEMEVFCGASYPERRVRFLVAECTAYDDTRIVSRCDMEKIAWILVTKTAGRSIGFVTAEQFREMEGDEEIPPAASIEPKLKE
jgi:hypothetical protein